jgi:uncharacterized protein (DUF2336 family)
MSTPARRPARPGGGVGVLVRARERVGPAPAPEPAPDPEAVTCDLCGADSRVHRLQGLGTKAHRFLHCRDVDACQARAVLRRRAAVAAGPSPAEDAAAGATDRALTPAAESPAEEAEAG